MMQKTQNQAFVTDFLAFLNQSSDYFLVTQMYAIKGAKRYNGFCWAMKIANGIENIQKKVFCVRTNLRLSI